MSIQTPAFEALKIQTESKLATQSLTELQQIMHLCENSDYIISIDGGGSKTLAQIIDPISMSLVELHIDGRSAQSITVGPTNISTVGFIEAQKNLQELMKSLSAVKIGSKKSIVCGIAGIISNADKKPAIMDIFAEFGFNESQVYLAGDLDLAKQLIAEEGAILISGTGSICFSKSAGIEKRIGGYGYALGDEGSGFYIGKLALQAALNAKYQNGVFALTDKLCELLQVASINEATKLFYNGTIKPADIAKSTPFVFDAAFKQNDPACKVIIEKAAAELAKNISCAVANSSKTDFPIYLIGGVFKNEHAPEFIEMIRKQVVYDHGLNFINIAEENIAMQVILSQAKVSNAAVPFYNY